MTCKLWRHCLDVGHMSERLIFKWTEYKKIEVYILLNEIRSCNTCHWSLSWLTLFCGFIIQIGPALKAQRRAYFVKWYVSIRGKCRIEISVFCCLFCSLSQQSCKRNTIKCFASNFVYYFVDIVRISLLRRRTFSNTPPAHFQHLIKRGLELISWQ